MDELEELRAWRAVLIPLSSLSSLLFFASMDRSGGACAASALSLIATTVLSLWAVATIVRIDHLEEHQGRD